MLVISRRIGESFVIAEDLEVTVIDITGGKVVLGVVAPKTVPIVRLSAPADREHCAVNQKGYGRQYKKTGAGKKESADDS